MKYAGKFEGHGRGLRRGFQYDRVAAEKSGNQFPRRDGNREIPRRDESYHSQRFASGVEQIPRHLMGNRLPTEGITDATGKSENIGRSLHFTGGLSEGFPFFAGEEFREFGFSRFENLPGFAQNSTPADRRRRGPFGEGGVGRIKGRRKIRGSARSIFGDRFAQVGRIHGGEPFARLSGHPLATHIIRVAFHANDFRRNESTHARALQDQVGSQERA